MLLQLLSSPVKYSTWHCKALTSPAKGCPSPPSPDAGGQIQPLAGQGCGSEPVLSWCSFPGLQLCCHTAVKSETDSPSFGFQKATSVFWDFTGQWFIIPNLHVAIIKSADSFVTMCSLLDRLYLAFDNYYAILINFSLWYTFCPDLAVSLTVFHSILLLSPLKILWEKTAKQQ